MKTNGWWRWGAVVVVLALSGCQHMVRVNYETEPYGATLEAGGAYIGRGSGTETFPISAEDWRNGVRCVKTYPVVAQWLSGAQASLAAEQLCVPDKASGFSDIVAYRLLRRPDGVEGLELDVGYGSDLVAQELAARRVAAEEAAARAEQAQADAIRDEAEAIREHTEAFKEQEKKDRKSKKS